MAWFYLFIAALFEIGWAVGLKYSAGFTRLWPSVFTLGAMGLSLALLAAAVRAIPLGTAYAIWTGVGAVGTVAYGMLLLGEPVTLARGLCLLLILGGVVGLKLTA